MEVTWQVKLLHSEYFAAGKVSWNPTLKKSRSLKSPMCWGYWSALGHKGVTLFMASSLHARIAPSPMPE